MSFYCQIFKCFHTVCQIVNWNTNIFSIANEKQLIEVMQMYKLQLIPI